MPQPLQNDLLLRALEREETPRAPVWIMRQAGRYLPEYRAAREKAGSFLNLARDPQLAAEVTVQPVDRLGVDAAIVFSDILTVPDAMGLGLRFAEGVGPTFERPVREESDVNALRPADLDKLSYVFEAVAQSKKALAGRVPLIGFAGSPFTLLCYMIEGGAPGVFQRAKSMMFARPDLFEKALGALTDSVAAYLERQIISGADALQIFDSWGGVLSGHAFRRFSLEPMKQIIAKLPRVSPLTGRKVPVILYCKGGGQWLADMADSGASALGVDWMTSMAWAKKQTGGKVALQGNMDPMALFGGPESIDRETRLLAQEYGRGPGLVVNLGHGIDRRADPEMAKYFVDSAKRATSRSAPDR